MGEGEGGGDLGDYFTASGGWGDLGYFLRNFGQIRVLLAIDVA